MGGAIGKPITLQVRSCETRKVRLLPGELKLENSVLIVASTLLWIVPDPLHWELFFLAKLALSIAIAVYIRYDMKKQMKGKLLLTDEGSVSPEELPQQLRKQKM